MIKVGAVVYDPKVTIIWEKIKEYYKNKGMDITPVYYKDYDLQVSGLVNKEIDIAWNSPLARLDTVLRFDGREKIGPMRDTDRDLCSYFVVRKDSNIDSIEDLKDKKIGFGAVDSPQARLIPINCLKKHGLEFGRDYLEYQYNIGIGLHGDHVGGEKDAILDMVDGVVDASICLGANYKAWIKDGTIDENSVKVIGETDSFDHCVFSAHPDLDDEKLNEFSKIMLEMDYEKPDEKEIMDLEGLTEWKEGRVSGYEQITQVNEYLNFITRFNR